MKAFSHTEAAIVIQRNVRGHLSRKPQVLTMRPSSIPLKSGHAVVEASIDAVLPIHEVPRRGNYFLGRKNSYDKDKMMPHPLPREVRERFQVEYDHIGKLARAFQTNGFDLSKRIDAVRLRDGSFVCMGHHRLAALKRLNQKTVPIDYQDFDELSAGRRDALRDMVKAGDYRAFEKMQSLGLM